MTTLADQTNGPHVSMPECCRSIPNPFVFSLWVQVQRANLQRQASRLSERIRSKGLQVATHTFAAARESGCTDAYALGVKPARLSCCFVSMQHDRATLTLRKHV